jgi:hypothetical protein
MIQRIQTIFLLGVTIISVMLLFFPFVEYTSVEHGKFSISLMPGNNAKVNAIFFLPVVLNFLNLIFSIFVILQFKKRVIQIKLASLLMAFNSIMLGTMLLFDFISVEAGKSFSKSYLFGSYLPILSILLSFMAIRFIKKDEELVRSADRLR